MCYGAYVDKVSADWYIWEKHTESNLLEAMANAILEQETELDEGRDASAMDVRLRELALEELKVKMEADIRIKEREADARNKEREVEMRKIELGLDTEMRKKQLEVDMEVRILELREQQETETIDVGYVCLDLGPMPRMILSQAEHNVMGIRESTFYLK